MTTRKQGSAPARPWYRQLWPWLLMLPPAAAVAGGVGMLYLALTTSSDLVVADYARIEELTGQRFAQDARAVELNLSAEVSFAAISENHVLATVRLTDNLAPNVVRLELQHATRHDFDTAVTLGPALDGPPGVYAGEFELPPARYELELVPLDRAWRLAGELTRLPQTLSLRPQSGTGE